MADVEIERDEHSQRFVILHNHVARDKRMSRRARGLLAELLSYPPTCKVTSETLAEGGPEGRDAIRATLRELEDYGYITRTKKRDDHGRWQTIMKVRETPVDNPATGTGNPSPARPAGTRITPGRNQDGFSGAGKPGAKELKTDTKDGRKDGFDLPRVAPPTSVDAAPPDVYDKEDQNQDYRDDPAPLGVILADFGKPRDPANAEKNKILSGFATGGLAKSRSDVAELRPAATRFADLCVRCSGNRQHEVCPAA